jgi:mannose-1-phosphate guanylyltransferase/mannose-6-phosphate isomerase
MGKNNFYVVILAGGSGTRFWPSSRAANPKQFLALTGERSLLQETLSRVRSKAQGDRIYIVTNKRFKKMIARQTKGLGIPPGNILLEPSGKNTAPAIAWAASLIHRRDPNAVMAVLPSDHLIANPSAYLKILNQAALLANDNYLVTLGIVPTRPETGYGYIKGRKVSRNRKTVYEVEKFVEKPSLPKAQEYLKTKKYYWNSGMFIWKAGVILDEFKMYLPAVYKVFAGAPSQKSVEKSWAGLPGVSIDYGVMEKAKRVAVVPAAGIGWSDVGSWEALWEVSAKTKDGNSFKGDVLADMTRNSLVVGGKRLVALVGLDDIVVVDTPDVLLVCRKSQSQSVKNIVEALKAQKQTERL